MFRSLLITLLLSATSQAAILTYQNKIPMQPTDWTAELEGINPVEVEVQSKITVITPEPTLFSIKSTCEVVANGLDTTFVLFNIQNLLVTNTFSSGVYRTESAIVFAHSFYDHYNHLARIYRWKL